MHFQTLAADMNKRNWQNFERKLILIHSRALAIWFRNCVIDASRSTSLKMSRRWAERKQEVTERRRKCEASLKIISSRSFPSCINRDWKKCSRFIFGFSSSADEVELKWNGGKRAALDERKIPRILFAINKRNVDRLNENRREKKHFSNPQNVTELVFVGAAAWRQHFHEIFVSDKSNKGRTSYKFSTQLIYFLIGKRRAARLVRLSCLGLKRWQWFCGPGRRKCRNQK